MHKHILLFDDSFCLLYHRVTSFQQVESGKKEIKHCFFNA